MRKISSGQSQTHTGSLTVAPAEVVPVEVFVANFERLKKIAGGVGVTGSDVEDVLQDVSVEAVRTDRRFADEGQVLRWLIRITVNRCFLDGRRKGRFKRAADGILQRLKAKKTQLGPHQSAVEVEELEMVRQSLKKLDAEMMAPLVLKYYCNLNSVEIGEILSLVPASVRSRLRKGRLVLAKSLIDKGLKS